MPNMLQIEPSQATGTTKEAFDEAKRQFGGVINLFKVTGNAPNVLKGFLALNAGVNDGIELTGKEIEQVAMPVAANTGRPSTLKHHLTGRSVDTRKETTNAKHASNRTQPGNRNHKGGF